jgi:hypothetical protein
MMPIASQLQQNIVLSYECAIQCGAIMDNKQTAFGLLTSIKTSREVIPFLSFYVFI